MTDESRLYRLFSAVYQARTEEELNKVIVQEEQNSLSLDWYPLGGMDDNYGIVENQQSKPVAAVVEKLTNAIDAILMRRCLEEGISPTARDEAPQSISEAVDRFFPDNKNWDLSTRRNQQAESIQIIGDGYRGKSAETSLIIYDNGEGQHPENFEDTLLSLFKGNKNEIHFVHGKYNMGGCGAIAFCGKRRYQLIASKRYDGTGLFGFTLIRKHPPTKEEAQTKKSIGYEYLKIDGNIPAFGIEKLDLNLYNRQYSTGTIIKLYSYDVKNNKNVRRDLGRSINEFLYEPALPIYTVDTKERYPKERALESAIFGLKRRLESAKDYIETTFSEEYENKKIGKTKVTVHIFKPRAKNKTASETRKTIQNEFFKNRMAILFSLNGQVHGHFTSEFITRSLQFGILRDYLLIHVDCTSMHMNFRQELFMASRDRLKDGEESKILRRFLADNLKKGQLREIFRRRKDNISIDTTDDDVIKSFAKNLPINKEMHKLLSQAFKLDHSDKSKKNKPRLKAKSPSNRKSEKSPFLPQRFPSFFNIDVKKKGNTHVFTVPLNGERTIQFNSDVENQYFDRIDEPGEIRIAIMDYLPNDVKGGKEKGEVNNISEVINVVKRSPNDGKIKVVFSPTDDVSVGDEVQIRAELNSPDKRFNQVFWIKITDPEAKPKKKNSESDEEPVGLPKLVKIFQSAQENQDVVTWDRLEESGVSMGFDHVLHVEAQGDVLETIYINMDSTVFKNYKSRLRSLEQHQVADRRYVSAVYFHTLFLYIVSKKQNLSVYQKESDIEPEKPIPIAEYLKGIFSSAYADFLLNFGTGELMVALG